MQHLKTLASSTATPGRPAKPHDVRYLPDNDVMRYCASRPSPAVDAKAMSVDIHRVAATSGSEGLTLMLEEFC